MAINQLIAQGIRPIGADLPQIGGLLMQKRQAEAQEARQNELLKLQQGGLEQDRLRMEAELAAREQRTAAEKREEARQWLSNNYETVAGNPEVAPRLIQFGKQRGYLPPDYRDDASVDDLALEFGIQRPQKVQQLETIQGPGGAILQRDPVTGKLTQVVAPRAPAGGGGPRGPNWQKIEQTLPDGRKVTGVIDMNSADPSATFRRIGDDGAAQQPARDPITENKLTFAQNTLSAIDEALGQISFSTTGLGGAVMRNVAGSGAVDLDSNINTIKANVGFDRLQMMREASKTGGALGQVAVQELTMLQAVIASLDPRQSGPQLERNLLKVREQYEKAVNAYRDMLSGGSDYLNQTAPTMPSDVDAILKKYGGR